MPRPEKVQAVEEIKDSFRQAGAVLVTEYRGLKVKELQDLRRRLAGAGARYQILKNTLVRFAVRDLEFGELESYLEGPTAIAFCGDDPVAPAKVCSEFARTNPNLVLKAGVLQGQVLDTDRTKALSELEPREILLAKAAGALKAPLTQAVGVVQALIRNAVAVVAAYQRKREEAGEALPAATGSDVQSPAPEEPVEADPESSAVTTETTEDPPEGAPEAAPDTSPEAEPETPSEEG